jgi:uncharacterized protein YgbK (DUF1537 family)
MTAPPPSDWPAGLLLSFYGDDFTGSTDAMDAFTTAGLPTVLFVTPPRVQDLARFPLARCVGLAGLSRGQSPEWMNRELPAAFASLASLGAPILQYKVCSTFDSSPAIGSIGRAIDLGVRAMPGSWSPMVVGAPRLRRFQMFGNLFAAAADGVVYRLDRHPSMSRHPVTPMDEADLRVHLARQTRRRIELIDLAQMGQGLGQPRYDSLRGEDRPVVMLDVCDAATQREAGRLVWENRGTGVFSASSSGLQYALTAHWRALGLLPEQTGLPLAAPVPCIAAVSGSCSPMSAAQIQWARARGFHTSRLDVRQCFDDARAEIEIERLAAQAIALIGQGVSPIVYSAEGPDDPAVTSFDGWVATAGISRTEGALRIGRALAEVMRRILDRCGVRRVVVAGGDSSGAVASHLGIQALTVAAGLSPGVPLCRAWSDRPERDGLEIALKGGQFGTISFYGDVREGRPHLAS